MPGLQIFKHILIKDYNFYVSGIKLQDMLSSQRSCHYYFWMD